MRCFERTQESNRQIQQNGCYYPSMLHAKEKRKVVGIELLTYLRSADKFRKTADILQKTADKKGRTTKNPCSRCAREHFLY